MSSDSSLPQLRQLFLTPDLPLPANLRPSIRQRRIRRERPPFATLPLLTTLQPTKAINIAIALLRIRTMHRFPPKDDMPAILQHPSADMIIQTRLQDPIPEPVVVREGPFADLLPYHGELGAAGHSDGVGEVLAWEEGFEGCRVGKFGRFGGF